MFLVRLLRLPCGRHALSPAPASLRPGWLTTILGRSTVPISIGFANRYLTSEPANDSPRKTRRKWTQEEDEKLRKGIELYGFRKWVKISTLVATRSDLRCRQRWTECLSPDVKKGLWSELENAQLKTGVAKFGEGNWTAIARTIAGRTAQQCRKRWTEHVSPKIKRGNWTVKEDMHLKVAVEKLGAGNWKYVAKAVPGRTAKQCRARWTLCVNPDIRRGVWTAAEDEALVAAVQQYGEGKWIEIADTIQGRTGLQCRERWTEYLSPNVTKRP
ncbi:Myb-like DNA-binding domain protein, partial [Quaeritorhiza haematococci]